MNEKPLPLTEIDRNQGASTSGGMGIGEQSVAETEIQPEIDPFGDCVADNLTDSNSLDNTIETGMATATETEIDSSDDGVIENEPNSNSLANATGINTDPPSGNETHSISSARIPVTPDMLSSALNAVLSLNAPPIKNEPAFSALNVEDEQAIEEALNNSYEAWAIVMTS